MRSLRSTRNGIEPVDIAVLYCYDAIYECDLACSHQGSPRRRVDRGDRHLGAARAVAPERSSLQSTACSTARAAVNHVFTSVEQLLDDFERDIANWSQTMKAIIEVACKGSAVRTARTQLAVARQGKTPDFRLSFESAKSLFADLTPARLDLLDSLRKSGPCSVYALAKAAERNYSNVHTDVARLEELGLIERNDDGAVWVPYDAVEILLPLAQVA